MATWNSDYKNERSHKIYKGKNDGSLYYGELPIPISNFQMNGEFPKPISNIQIKIEEPHIRFCLLLQLFLQIASLPSPHYVLREGFSPWSQNSWNSSKSPADFLTSTT